MEPKVELYTAICTAMDRPDAKAAIWEIPSVSSQSGCSSYQTASSSAVAPSVHVEVSMSQTGTR